jgi:hypothetical protein
MKRLFFLLMLAVLSCACAYASPATSHARLTPVKSTHYRRDPRVNRHRAHKAAKHHAPKRHRHAV